MILYRRIGASRRVSFPRLGVDYRCGFNGNFGATISGYTLLEVVAILIIVGILAAVLAPQFIDATGFTGQTTADQFLAAARYAETLAQNQDVATKLVVKAKFFKVTQNGTTVPSPTLQSSTLVVNLPAGVTITPYPYTITFQPQLGIAFKKQGLPNKAKTFKIKSAGPTVMVHVTATGYIYECQTGGPCP